MNIKLLIIIYITLYLLLTYKSIKSYNLMDNSYNNGNIMTTNIKDYKKLFQQKRRLPKEKKLRLFQKRKKKGKKKNNL